MNRTTKAVGVRIGRVVEDEFEGVIEWHAPPAGPTDYVTLCGIDGDDPETEQHGLVAPTVGQKITCATCRTIWRDVLNMGLRESDFTRGNTK